MDTSARPPRLPDDALAAPLSRRRLLKGSLSAAPVLMTLASRPVIAGQCVPCSAWSSLSGSLATKNLASCAGKSPTTWVATATWPDPYHPTTKNGSKGWDATLYHCTTTGLSGTIFSPSTMLAVMQLSDDNGMRTLGRYTAAALLNARLGLTPVLTETTVRAMWNDLLTRGYFEPTAGVRWGSAQIVAYLKTTIG